LYGSGSVKQLRKNSAFYRRLALSTAWNMSTCEWIVSVAPKTLWMDSSRIKTNDKRYVYA